jgi:hypothetical protein
MHIIFKYSLNEEIKEYIELLRHYSQYKNLRSVVKSPFPIICLFINNQKYCSFAENLWRSYESATNRAFNELNFHLEKDVIKCYLHGISSEGWINFEKYDIHARILENASNRDLVDTIIHELMHLALDKEEGNFEDREDLVEKYMKDSIIKQLFQSTKM